MKGAEFIRKIRKPGRQNGVAVLFDPTRGVGSHGTLFYGTAFTIVKDRKKELGKKARRSMLEQLGLPKDLFS